MAGGVAGAGASVSERVREVRRRVAAAGRDPGDVAIVAVTKGFDAEVVRAARAAGLHDLGENYVEELTAKHDGQGRWHYLGAVQRRKVRRVAALVDVWQGVDRMAAGEEIAAHAPGAAVLVQVNVSGEAHRNGCGWDDVEPLVRGLLAAGLDVRGLMCVAPMGPPDGARPHFRRLAATADALGLPERSMGMTEDFEVAVQEGATMIRLGTALFGPRPVDRRDAPAADGVRQSRGPRR